MKNLLYLYYKNKYNLLALLFSSLFISSSMYSQQVYYAVLNGPIQRINLDGSGQETLVNSGLSTVQYVSVYEGKIYWTHETDKKIMRSNLDGSEVEDLITGLNRPHGLDVAAGKVYISEKNLNQIWRANIDGSNLEMIISNASAPTGIVADPDNNKIYWLAQGANNGSLRRANLDGTSPETLISGLQYCLHDIAIDSGGGKVYWSNVCENKIRRANTDGNSQEELLSSQPDVLGLDLDLNEGKMYFADDKLVKRANLDGSNLETILNDPSLPHSIYGLALGTTPEVVPTMGEWALIIFALTIMSMGVVTVMRWEKERGLVISD